MRQLIKHPWSLSPSEAIELQYKLKRRIKFEPVNVENMRLIAGVDASYSKRFGKTIAGVVVYDRLKKEVVEETYAVCDTEFPYVPGLLAFREGRAVCMALESLKTDPDCVMFDGHGYSHPRRMGIATHIGVLFDAPSIGCAKSKLSGEYEADRDFSLVYDKKRCEILAVAVRTKRNTKHIFVSVGNRMNLDSALRLTLSCIEGYRLPQPTRFAHLFVTRLKDELKFSS